MADKNLKARIVNKNGTSVEWEKATSFIPKKGELILYTDLNKIKIGDGVTVVGDLPFSDDDKVSKAGDTMTGILGVNLSAYPGGGGIVFGMDAPSELIIPEPGVFGQTDNNTVSLLAKRVVLGHTSDGNLISHAEFNETENLIQNGLTFLDSERFKKGTVSETNDGLGMSAENGACLKVGAEAVTVCDNTGGSAILRFGGENGAGIESTENMFMDIAQKIKGISYHLAFLHKNIALYVENESGVQSNVLNFFDGNLNLASDKCTVEMSGAGPIISLIANPSGPVKITGVMDGASNSDAVNYGQLKALKTEAEGAYVKKTGDTMTGDLKMGDSSGTVKGSLSDTTDGIALSAENGACLKVGAKAVTVCDNAGGASQIKGVKTPVDDTDAVNKKYVDDAIPTAQIEELSNAIVKAEPFFVEFTNTGTIDDPQWSANKTFSEIKSAHDTGRLCYAQVEQKNVIVPLIGFTEYNAKKKAIFSTSVLFSSHLNTQALTITEDNLISIERFVSQSQITTTGLLKGDGDNITAAVAGTDYAAAEHTHDTYTATEIDTMWNAVTIS